MNLLIVAFGGPTPGCCHRFDTCPGEAYCFVSGIFGDNPARKARVEEVVEHYKELGGFSRFNEITEAQADALKAELARRGHDVNVTVGYDHWNPYIRDKVAELPAGQDFVALVLAPHQSSVSWDGYLRRISEGLEALPENARPKWAGVCEPFYDKAGFIDALADHIRKAAGSIGADLTAGDTGLLLSAHAVPMPVVRTSKYVDQIKETAALVARKLNAHNWMVGFQSAPGDSNIEWTTPYIEQAMEQLKDSGANKIVAAPIGFLCDNVEVLHDLGIEGKEHAEKIGVTFAVAEAVNTNPAFIGALADQVTAALGGVKSGG
jgi:protoporphyrin/coproporphyrin ferrochelatase